MPNDVTPSPAVAQPVAATAQRGFTQHYSGPFDHPSASNDGAMLPLPLFGRIAAGTPIEALRDYNTFVDVPKSLLGSGEHYALEVEGDSMIEAGILEGDTVLIERTDSAENGSIIVALVDNEEATLKRLRRKGGAIALEPANKNYETRIFPPERVRVQGRLIGLLRRY
jgi:repressor LexA